MEDRFKELMQELGNAINESLSDSDRIAAAIGEIKRCGYDIFLVLEATIGFQKREGAEPVPQQAQTPDTASPGRIEWTEGDVKFLKALKINLDQKGGLNG